jgi:hypothetical protein
MTLALYTKGEVYFGAFLEVEAGGGWVTHADNDNGPTIFFENYLFSGNFLPIILWIF